MFNWNDSNHHPILCSENCSNPPVWTDTNIIIYRGGSMAIGAMMNGGSFVYINAG